jgi:hypothetical protein
MRQCAYALLMALLIAVMATVVSALKDDGTGRIDGKDSDYELVKVIVLNRHGHRAPNEPFWSLCPNELANRAKFRVGAEDLTRVGFEEELHCGEYLKKMYPDFITDNYNRSNHFVQASGEPRTLQSAMAITNGAFPVTRKSPSRILPHHPNLVPVFSSNINREYFLGDVPCRNATDTAVTKWLNSQEGKDLYQANEKLLKHIMKQCGTSEAAQQSVTLDLLVKLLVDGLIFEHDFGLEPLKGHLSKREFMDLRNLSQEFLFGKLYGTDAQRTFTAAEFPHFLVKQFEFLAGNPVQDTWNDNQVFAIRTPLNIFIVHREQIYGLSFFYDFRYYAKNMAYGEVPSGAAFIFEYLRSKTTKAISLRVKMWTPHDGELPVEVPMCERVHTCTRDEFAGAYINRTMRTGRWDVICNFPRPSAWFHPGVM